MKVDHGYIKPIYNEKSEILILGTIPSPKSREVGFYYAHPQNRFWKVLSDIYNISLISKDDNVSFLLDNHIALWDVIASCDITGASDSSITNIVPNDIASVLKKTNIKYIFTTGKKATELYKKYIFKQTNIESIYLPSTSPANCSIKYEELKEAYNKVKEYQQ